MSKLVSLAALVVATGAWMALRRSPRSTLRREGPRAKPEPVQTWEGEGGALPATGAQMGPDPTVSATAQDAGQEALRRDPIPGIH